MAAVTNPAGQAMVLGWDQTIKSLWNQQFSLAAQAGGGIPIEVLETVMPDLPPDKARQYLPHLNAAMAEAEITTPARQAAFLAQLAHESVQLRYFEELGDDEYFEENYGGREDLGNTQPGDGARYHGRGPIQLTGRHNYREAGEALGLDLENNPERAADPDVGFRIAGWYWTSRNINEVADLGDAGFVEVTERINGGTNGMDARWEYYERAKEALARHPQPAPETTQPPTTTEPPRTTAPPTPAPQPEREETGTPQSTIPPWPTETT